jgi:hypothetical protein
MGRQNWVCTSRNPGHMDRSLCLDKSTTGYLRVSQGLRGLSKLYSPQRSCIECSTHASDKAARREKGGAPLLIGNADDNRKHVVESNQCRFVDPADGLAALFAGHGDDFIDHHL